MPKSKRSILDSFLNSKLWQSYEHDYSLNLQHWYVNDAERAERMEAAFSEGESGLTHAEVITDWLECVDSSDFAPGTKERLRKEIEECRTWHEQNGSIDDVQ